MNSGKFSRNREIRIYPMYEGCNFKECYSLIKEINVTGLSKYNVAIV